MSVLEPEWRSTRWQERAVADGRAVGAGSAETKVPSGAAREAADVAEHRARPADAARAAFRAQMEAPGHAVENARLAADGLDAAFASGALVKTPTLEGMLADLAVALEQDDGQKLGGKSRRGGAVHPAGHRPRARQRLTDRLDSRVARGFRMRRHGRRPAPHRPLRAAHRADDRDIPSTIRWWRQMSGVSGASSASARYSTSAPSASSPAPSACRSHARSAWRIH